MESFTPLTSTLGGLLIGASAALALLVHGRSVGISGILGGLLPSKVDRTGFQLAFVAGLVLAGTVGGVLVPDAFSFEIARSKPALIIAGLLVGYGTQLGRGCTSGHGVCGMGRFNRRSIIATATFMTTGGLTVAAITHLFGGAL
jgi:uncharacterized membrane protein YedE/YeeE